MHDERVTTRLGHLAGEVEQLGIAVAIIDTDPGLDRDRHLDRRLHRRDTVGHQPRLGHQTGAEATRLHPVRWTADVHVDLVIAPVRAQTCTLGHLSGVRAAELERHRVLARIEAQKAHLVTVEQGARGHHLGIELGLLGDQTQKAPAMPVGPIQHGRDAESQVTASLCSGWLSA